MEDMTMANSMDPRLMDYLVDNFIENNIIKTAATTNPWDMLLLPNGRKLCERNGLVFPEMPTNPRDTEGRTRAEGERKEIIQHAISNGTIEADLDAGHLTPMFFDFRHTCGLPKEPRRIIRDGQVDMARNSGVNIGGVASVAYGGNFMGALVADSLDVPHATFRKEKENTFYSPLVGSIPHGPNQRVWGVDDITASGDSSLGFVNDVRAFGGNIHDLSVLLDRGEGAIEKLATAGVNVHTLFNRTQMKQSILKSGKIDSGVKEMIDDRF